jgi:hypothetical protein
LASKRHCTMSFALSILWSKFKSVGEHENAEIAFVLLQRERERGRARRGRSSKKRGCCQDRL